MKQVRPPTYIAYMLRLWREDATTWRGTLENPHTGEQHHFATAEALFIFLQTQLTETAVSDAHSPPDTPNTNS
ncbi:MAG: hypothetical protein R3E31_03530 [Chloroflexota bacterium]|nr:hypothetical protein [Anaerolineales bacterium]MCB8968977.1 hypothetical protein [Ardenticatenaceae bacterium]